MTSSALTPSPWRTIIEAMFKIVDKDGQTVDFKLNPVQARLDAEWSRRNIIPKARQPGVSSYVIARFTAKCITMENRTCVLVSHEADATQRLLNRANFYISNIKGGAKPTMGRHSRNELYFKDTNSTFYIGTAGGRTFGHGDTITDLHLSEVARYDDPERIVQGTFPAAERGEITLESTGNGIGNYYHRQCVRAREGIGFKLHFFPWQDIPEYQLPFDDAVAREAFATSLSPEWEEVELATRGITLEQLQWRRERLQIDFEGNLKAFKEAYPFEFDDCFQSKEYGFFNAFRFKEATWTKESATLHVLEGHPVRDYTYVLGADVAGGVGGDNSVASVWCLETREQVAEYASSQVEPDQFGDVVNTLARRFNFAYVNVERNNHGLVTIRRLLDVYLASLIHRNTHQDDTTQEVLRTLMNYGTQVGPANRGIIIGTARRLLREDFTVHSPLLKSELSTFVEKEDGKIEADKGCHDDRVFAACHALTVVERAGLIAASGERPAELTGALDADPFSWHSLFGRLREGTRMYDAPEMYH